MKYSVKRNFNGRGEEQFTVLIKFNGKSGLYEAHFHYKDSRLSSIKEFTGETLFGYTSQSVINQCLHYTPLWLEKSGIKDVKHFVELMANCIGSESQ